LEAVFLLAPQFVVGAGHGLASRDAVALDWHPKDGFGAAIGQGAVADDAVHPSATGQKVDDAGRPVCSAVGAEMGEGCLNLVAKRGGAG
jgi:hypothetical protein